MIKILILIFIILQIFLSTSQNIVIQLQQPLGNKYTTDMRAFLKTVQLMRNGSDFYPAFHESMGNLQGSWRPDINAWRQPFIFYAWKYLPIYLLWQLLLVAIVICAYLISKNILSPIILWPYLHYSLTDLTILQPEWWGMAFLIFGLTSHIYKNYHLSIIFFLFSFMCRELNIISIFFITLFNLRKYFLFYILVFSSYILHLYNIFQFNTEWLRSYSNGSWRTLHYIFAYGSWEYIIGVYRPILITFIITTAAFFIRHRHALLFTSYFPFFLFTAIMAITGKIDATRDYWSIYFVPMLLICAPAIIFPSGKYVKTL